MKQFSTFDNRRKSQINKLDLLPPIPTNVRAKTPIKASFQSKVLKYDEPLPKKKYNTFLQQKNVIFDLNKIKLQRDAKHQRLNTLNQHHQILGTDVKSFSFAGTNTKSSPTSPSVTDPTTQRCLENGPDETEKQTVPQQITANKDDFKQNKLQNQELMISIKEVRDSESDFASPFLAAQQNLNLIEANEQNFSAQETNLTEIDQSKSAKMKLSQGNTLEQSPLVASTMSIKNAFKNLNDNQTPQPEFNLQISQHQFMSRNPPTEEISTRKNKTQVTDVKFNFDTSMQHDDQGKLISMPSERKKPPTFSQMAKSNTIDTSNALRVQLVSKNPVRKESTLSNAFNELNMSQKLQKKLMSNVTTEFEVNMKAQNAWLKIGKKGALLDDHGYQKTAIYDQFLGSLGGNKDSPMKKQRQQAKDQHNLSPEKCTFNQHFDIIKVLSLKCTVNYCYKLNDKIFVLKKLPQEILELQQYHDKVMGLLQESLQRKKLNKVIDVDLYDDWTMLVPMMPLQNFVTCSGIIKQDDSIYIVQEFIQDDYLTTSQRNQYFVQANHSDLNRYVKSDTQVNIKDAKKTLTQEDDTSSLAESVDFLQSHSTEKKETQDSFVQMSHVFNSQEDEEETYYGLRAPKGQIQESLNMYDFISSLSLGNLSVMKEIPRFYIRYLLTFIIQISGAFAHTHKNGLIHGALDLSKILVQQIKDPKLQSLLLNTKGQQPVQQQKKRPSQHTSRKASASALNVDEDHQDHQHDYNDERFLNFFITDFQPYQSIKMMKKFDEDPDYQRIMRTLKPSFLEIQKMFFVKDIHAFANSIIEIMVGQCEKVAVQDLLKNKQGTPRTEKKQKLSDIKVDSLGNLFKTQDDKNNNNTKEADENQNRETPQQTKHAFINSIPLDLIPLNWSKCKETQYILEILQICFGPSRNLSKTNIGTVEKFEKIQDIAIKVYIQSFGQNESVFNYENFIFKRHEDSEFQKRLKSQVMNNKAVVQYLNIQSDTEQSEFQRLIKRTALIYDQAIQIYPENQVAILNRNLLSWNTGNLSDQEFHQFLKSELQRVDPELARVFYLLFKKHILGCQILCSERKDTVETVDKYWNMTSQITKQLLNHPDFLRQKRKIIKKSDVIKNKNRLAFIERTYILDKGVNQNQTLEIETKFITQGIFFSNNEEYTALVSRETVIIMGNKSGTRLYSQQLPHIQVSKSSTKRLSLNETSSIKDLGQELPIHQLMNNSGPTQTLNTEVADALDSPIKTEDGAQDQQMESSDSQSLTSGQHTGSILVRPIQIDQKVKLSKNSNQRDVDQMKQLLNIQVTNETDLASERASEMDQRNSSGQTVRQEKRFVEKMVQPNYIVALGNAGKQMVLFDKAQQDRNRLYEFEKNKEENMYVYTISFSKIITSIGSQTTMIDLRPLLNKQEVLSFTLGDYVHETHGRIYVQGKDLKIYIIDYDQNKVVKTISSHLFSINMSSIFYDLEQLDHNHQHQPFLKEKITEEERLGNVVKLPKKNDEIIAIKQRGTNIILLWDIKKRQVVRRFSLELQDPQFDVHEQSFGDDFLGSDNSSREEYKNEDGQMPVSKFSPCQSFVEEDDKEIKIFEVSPNATFLVAQIKNEIIIKMLNQVGRDQWGNTYEYQNSIMFMPIFFDEDYNYAQNKDRYQREFVKLRSYRSFGIEKVDKCCEGNRFPVKNRDITRVLKLYENLVKQPPGNIYVKNQQVNELHEFCNNLKSDPRMIFLPPLSLRLSRQKQSTLFEIMRSMQSIDKSAIESVQFSDLRLFYRFDKFSFERSTEVVKEFALTSSPNKFLMAVLTGKQVHVYDYILNKLLFFTNLSNQPQLSKSQNSPNLFFIDNDQVLVVRDGPKRLKLFSISLLMEENQKVQNVKNAADTVIKYPLPKPIGSEVDIGFIHLQKVLDLENADGRVSDEDSDGYENEASGKSSLEFEEDIENIFYSRFSHPYGFVALIGDYRLSIRYLYEETVGCEHDIKFDYSYKFNQKIRKFGKHNCVDFDDEARSLVTGTKQGWICCWSMAGQLEVAIKLPEEKGNIEQVTKIRDINMEQIIISHSKSTNNLFFIYLHEHRVELQEKKQEEITRQLELSIQALSSVKKYDANKTEAQIEEEKQAMQKQIVDLKSETLGLNQEKKDEQPSAKILSARSLDNSNQGQNNTTVMTPRIKKIKFDKETKGTLMNLHVDGSDSYLVSSFENGSISIFDIKEGINLREIPPLERCLINGLQKSARIIIDDECTFIAQLDPEQKEVIFYTLDWNMKVKKLEKPPNATKIGIFNKKTMIQKKITVGIEAVSMKSGMKSIFKEIISEQKQINERESKTCHIF